MLTILSVVVALAGAMGVLWLAWSLPGKHPVGVAAGTGIPLLGMVAWSYGDTPVVVWGLQAAIGIGAAVITYPWWSAARIWRRAGFWLVVPVWLTGTVSAVWLGRFTVAGQRLVYAGFAVLIMLVVFRATRRGDRGFSLGVAAGFLVCLALLLVSGAPEVLSGEHWTVGGEWGTAMADRFWGGPLLGYHPNFIGLTAVMVAMRLGPDPALPVRQRIASAVVAGGFLLLVESRTCFVVAFVASGVYALGVLRRRRVPVWRWFGTAASRRAVTVAFAPLLATGLVFAASGGVNLLVKDRYAQESAEGDWVNRLLSGRVDIWSAMLTDLAADEPVEWLFGDTGNARGVYYAITDPDDPDYAAQAKHTADNVLVGALYRGGVLGVAAVGAGLWLLLRRSGSGRPPPLWTVVVVVALLVGGITEDEIATVSPAWLLLCCAGANTRRIGLRTEHTAAIPPKSARSSPNGRGSVMAD